MKKNKIEDFRSNLTPEEQEERWRAMGLDSKIEAARAGKLGPNHGDKSVFSRDGRLFRRVPRFKANGTIEGLNDGELVYEEIDITPVKNKNAVPFPRSGEFGDIMKAHAVANVDGINDAVWDDIINAKNHIKLVYQAMRWMENPRNRLLVRVGKKAINLIRRFATAKFFLKIMWYSIKRNLKKSYDALVHGRGLISLIQTDRDGKLVLEEKDLPW